jgi:hypothetical protein
MRNDGDGKSLMLTREDMKINYVWKSLRKLNEGNLTTG